MDVTVVTLPLFLFLYFSGSGGWGGCQRDRWGCNCFVLFQF